jgi:hypothetical protein
MLRFVSRWRVRRAPDVGCCTQHGSQHGRKIVTTWEGGGRKTPDVECWTQHARNIYLLEFRSNG